MENPSPESVASPQPVFRVDPAKTKRAAIILAAVAAYCITQNAWYYWLAGYIAASLCFSLAVIIAEYNGWFPPLADYLEYGEYGSHTVNGYKSRRDSIRIAVVGAPLLFLGYLAGLAGIYLIYVSGIAFHEAIGTDKPKEFKPKTISTKTLGDAACIGNIVVWIVAIATVIYFGTQAPQ